MMYMRRCFAPSCAFRYSRARWRWRAAQIKEGLATKSTRLDILARSGPVCNSAFSFPVHWQGNVRAFTEAVLRAFLHFHPRSWLFPALYLNGAFTCLPSMCFRRKSDMSSSVLDVLPTDRSTVSSAMPRLPGESRPLVRDMEVWFPSVSKK